MICLFKQNKILGQYCHTMGIHIHFVGMPGEFLCLTARLALLTLSSRPGMHVQASECLKEGVCQRNVTQWTNYMGCCAGSLLRPDLNL